MEKKGEEGMIRQWIWSVIPMLLVGCVSSGEYERVQSQYEHLKEVKTEWETEKDDLQQRVDAVHRAYSNVSKEQGTLRLQQDQTKIEVARARDDSRLLTGKLASQEARVSALDQKFSKVLDQLSLLAETNVTLTNRVESLIARMGALMVRLKPVVSRDSKARAPEMRREAAAKDGENRPDEGLRETVSKAGPSTQVQSDSGEDTRKGEKPESPAVEQAMRQLGVKAEPSAVVKGAGKSTVPVRSDSMTETSKIPQGAGDANRRQASVNTTRSAAKNHRSSKGEQETDASAQKTVVPEVGVAAKGVSLPTDASGSLTGAPAEALAAPPPGALTFSPQSPAGSTGPPKGEKSADGTQR
jgi:hypothetical protein